MINESQQLSDRERQILHLVATGRSNQQIANDLGISVNTVKVHLRNVFGKIGAASRTEATMYAVRHGIVTVDRPLAELQAELEREPLVPPAEPSVDEPTVSVVEAEPATLAPDALPTVDPPVMPTPLAAPPAVESSTPPAAPVTQTLAAPHPRRSRLMPALVGGLALLVLILAGVVFVLQRRSAAVQTPPAPLNEARWSTLPELPTARAAFAIAATDNRLFVIGGESDAGVLGSVLRYDPRAQAWIELSSKPTAVADVRAVKLGDRLYVPGGRRSADSKDITTAFERYDPRSESWERLKDLPAPRSAYALAAFEGKLYLFGGWDGTAYRAEVFAYDPDQDSWSERTAMPTPRAFADAAVVEGSVYVLGGEADGGPLATNEQYQPSLEATQPWQRRPPMRRASTRFGAVPVLSTIYVFGGTAADTTALAYDVQTERWQALETPAVIGGQPGIALLEDTIVAVGGKLAAGYSAQVQGYQALFRAAIPQLK